MIKEILDQNLEENWEKIDLKFYYCKEDYSYNVVFFGSHAPSSECCNINIMVQISRDLGGRIICPHRNCVIKCLANFIISKEHREKIWDMKEEGEKSKQNKTANKGIIEQKWNNYDYFRDSMVLKDGKTLTAPKDKFSKFIDPLLQVLTSHKKLKH